MNLSLLLKKKRQNLDPSLLLKKNEKEKTGYIATVEEEESDDGSLDTVEEDEEASPLDIEDYSAELDVLEDTDYSGSDAQDGSKA